MELNEAVNLFKKANKELNRVPTRQDMISYGMTDWLFRKFPLNKLKELAGVEDEKSYFEAIPKIGVLDIEVSPSKAFVFQMFESNIYKDQIVKEWQILSYAILDYQTDDILYNDQSKDKDDKKLLEKMAKDVQKFDIIITFNGKKFDKKKFVSRLAFHDLEPIADFHHIDIYTEIKKVFSLSYNSLDYCCHYFGLKEKKSDHGKFKGIKIFIECLEGNKEAWKELKEYNIQDVKVTKELYQRVGKYIKGYNPNVFNDKCQLQCECGSFDIIKFGLSYTSKARKQVYKCHSCGRRFIGKENLITKEKRKFIF